MMGFFKTKIGKILIGFIALFVLINLLILFTGRTYLYKGVQETYLKGKTGPGIYDSLVFPTRIAAHSLTPEEWKVSNNLIELSIKAESFIRELNTTSFLVAKNGEIISESYYGEHDVYTRSNTFSMGKSFIGLAVGIAVDEGLIESFNSPISDYLPFHLANEEDVTIRDLLGMSSGLDWSESGADPFSDNAEAYYTSDLFAAMKTKKFTWEPGSKFEYVSGNSQLLGIILKEATGKDVTAYFEEKVWSKIGTERDLLWSLDRKNGVEKTFCCGYATTRDYAKMGQLILNEGSWNGEQIISKATLMEIISPYNETEEQYGLHFWIYNHPVHPAVYYRGILGQYIVVIPSLDVVMVRTGHNREEVYFMPEEKKDDLSFIVENGYKEHHPIDLFEYYEILNEVLEKHQKLVPDLVD